MNKVSTLSKPRPGWGGITELVDNYGIRLVGHLPINRAIVGFAGQKVTRSSGIDKVNDVA